MVGLLSLKAFNVRIIHCKYNMYISTSDIIIGFVETEYSVDEGETVTLNVVVLQGEPSGDVIVRLNTQPGSALCEYMHVETGQRSLIVCVCVCV